MSYFFLNYCTWIVCQKFIIIKTAIFFYVLEKSLSSSRNYCTYFNQMSYCFLSSCTWVVCWKFTKILVTFMLFYVLTLKRHHTLQEIIVHVSVRCHFFLNYCTWIACWKFIDLIKKTGNSGFLCFGTLKTHCTLQEIIIRISVFFLLYNDN